MLKIISFSFVVLLLISGCTSQNSQNYGQDFDPAKAAKTRVSLGLTYLKNGNYSQAKFNLDKALEFAPRSAEANFAMAYYYQSVSELEQAEEAYQFAMALDPKNPNIANSYGAFLCQNGDYQKAKTYFLKAVNSNSYISSAETYENLAMCSQNQGQPEETIQYLRNAVNHQPGRASSLYLLTQALVEAKQWQEAKETLRRYEKVSQVSPQSLMMAIEIARGMGNTVAAKGYVDMLLSIFPNQPITQSWLKEQQSTADKISQAVSSNKLIKAPEPTDIEVKSNSVTKKAEIAQNNVLVENVKKPSQENQDIVKPSTVKQQNLPEKAPQVEKTVEQTPTFHIVAKDENLYRISLLYNIRMQRLIEWNGLADESAIYAGKKLFLVAPSVVE